jgi:hypothetical protein
LTPLTPLSGCHAIHAVPYTESDFNEHLQSYWQADLNSQAGLPFCKIGLAALFTASHLHGMHPGVTNMQPSQVLNTQLIIKITRFSCQNRQGASTDRLQVKAPSSCRLLDSPDPSKTQSTVGTVLSTYTASRQPGLKGPNTHLSPGVER